MKVNIKKLALEMAIFLLVISGLALATTRITDTYMNTTGTVNGSVIWEGNVKIGTSMNATMKDYVDGKLISYNSSAGTFTISVNGTMKTYAVNVNSTMKNYADGKFQTGTELFNTTAQVWLVVDNGTFTKLSMNLWNTSAQMISAVNNSWINVSIWNNLYTPPAIWGTGNTTSQIWAVVDNSTFQKGTELFNTTADVMAAVNSTAINSTQWINTTMGMAVGSNRKICLDGATPCSKYIYYNGTAMIIQG